VATTFEDDQPVGLVLAMCYRLARQRARLVRIQQAAAAKQTDETPVLTGDVSSAGKSRSQNDRALS